MLRLRSTADFERVRRDGRSYAHPLLVLSACRRIIAADQAPPQSQIGFLAGRSVGSAVRRNRAKRLMRAAAHALADRLEPGWDLVLIARAPIGGCKMPEVQAALAQLLRRAHVLNSTSQ
jgi:ribonuclease P protein component